MKIYLLFANTFGLSIDDCFNARDVAQDVADENKNFVHYQEITREEFLALPGDRRTRSFKRLCKMVGSGLF